MNDVAAPALPSDPGRLARFDREALVLASLNHPNIATVSSIHVKEGALIRSSPAAGSRRCRRT
jgi:serine/threonine protein kinase